MSELSAALLLTLCLLSLVSCRTGQAGSPLCHMPESGHKDCEPGEAQRVSTNEGKTTRLSVSPFLILLFGSSIPSVSSLHESRPRRHLLSLSPCLSLSLSHSHSHSPPLSLSLSHASSPPGVSWPDWRGEGRGEMGERGAGRGEQGKGKVIWQLL